MQEQGDRELTGRRRELLDVLPALRRFALSLTGEAAAADELLQASLARLLERELPPGAELVARCVRVCRQVWAEQQQTAGDSAATEAARNEREAAPTAAREEVRVALAALPDDQRAALELVALEGHSYGAAAAMLDVPIGGIMHRLARARGTLISRCRTGWAAPPARKAVNT